MRFAVHCGSRTDTDTSQARKPVNFLLNAKMKSHRILSWSIGVFGEKNVSQKVKCCCWWWWAPTSVQWLQLYESAIFCYIYYRKISENIHTHFCSLCISSSHIFSLLVKENGAAINPSRFIPVNLNSKVMKFCPKTHYCAMYFLQIRNLQKSVFSIVENLIEMKRNLIKVSVANLYTIDYCIDHTFDLL